MLGRGTRRVGTHDSLQSAMQGIEAMTLRFRTYSTCVARVYRLTCPLILPHLPKTREREHRRPDRLPSRRREGTPVRDWVAPPPGSDAMAAWPRRELDWSANYLVRVFGQWGFRRSEE